MPATATLEIGQTAPDFKLKGPGGQFVSLSEYLGNKNVVLVFYPLAFSAVCSHQLPAIEKQRPKLEDLDATVLGISIDSHYANEAFARQLGLGFPLLSDFNHEVSQTYGVFEPQKGHSGRAVFVIDRQGRVAYKDISPAPGDMSQIPSLDAVIDALRKLKK